MKYLTIFYFIFISVTNASTCSTVENLWYKKGFTESESQASAQWCFAFSAATLLSWKTGKYVNPYHIGKRVHSQNRPNGMLDTFSLNRGGLIEDALRIGNIGACHENLSSHAISILKFLNDKNQVELCSKELDMSLPQLTHHLRSSVLNEIDQACPKNQLTNAGLRFQSLKFGEVYKNDRNISREKAFEAMDKFLSRGNPVGLSIDYSFIYNAPKNSLGHAATIVGRELNPQTGKCEYIIKDSARGCEERDNPRHREGCEKGMIRLTRKELLDHSRSFTVIR